MPTVAIKNINQFVEQEININGWVYNNRSSGKIGFLQLRDGTGIIQGVVVKGEVSEECFKLSDKISIESSVRVKGIVKKEPRSQSGFELLVTDIELVHLADEYPISNKEHGIDFLMDNRHLWLRSRKQWAIQKIRNTLIMATYEWMNQNDFCKIDSPIMTPNACEGTTTLFDVEYFDQGKAYLSQSGQLYIEAAIFSLGKVFDFGPVFRAEKSKTRRHLTEFWMMDAEAAFVQHDENMKIQEELISYMIQKVVSENKHELEILGRDIEPLRNIKAPFYRITHAEAVKKLQEMGSDIKADEDLGADDETIFTKLYDKPIFVEKYPAKVKAFYMKRDPQNLDYALCSDMLAPEGYGEIIGGSEREDDYETLLNRIKEEKLPLDEFQWYLDLRRYGSVPHSGFGFGLERIVAWVCGIQHIRETIPFPRTISRLKP